VALILFLISEIVARRERLLDLSVFRHQDFAFAFLVTFVAGFGLTGSSYLIPSFAVSVLGMTPTEAGWLLVPSGFVFIAALLAAALLIVRCSLPPIATVPFGILFFMGAMWLLAGSSGESGIPDMMPGVMLRGLGLGMLFLSLTLIALADLPRASLAYGVALFNVGRLVGGQIGTAALQTLIDRETAQNVTVLAADVTNGQISVMDRLHQTTGLLAGRGLEAGSAAKAAVGLLGRQVTLQATVISFDDAFLTVALLFVAAAPFLIAWKLVLARLMRGQSSP
jgi:DHA2 family multidrug resistance protein